MDYRSSFLCPTLVNPGLVAVGHRVCGGLWAAPLGEVVVSGLGAFPGIAPASHTAADRSTVDSHFGPLFPISFIPWLCNVPKGSKEPYPNQTNPNVYDFGSGWISNLCEDRYMISVDLPAYCDGGSTIQADPGSRSTRLDLGIHFGIDAFVW